MNRLPINSPRSISDDDLCSECALLDYRPGELSYCKCPDTRTWPAVFTADGVYVNYCREFHFKKQDKP